METDVILTTLKLAVISTAVTLLPAIPCALWLAGSNSWVKTVVSSLLSLPIVLPPSALGFYLLVCLGPHGLIGRVCAVFGMGPISFTFTGLVIAVAIASFPFVLAPIQTAGERISAKPLEVAATLGAAPLDRFFTIVLPQLRYAIATGCVTGFAHAIGAFGVVLMVGGSIPGRTRVMATALYEYVETSRYSDAHILAAVMAAGAFIMLLLMNRLGRGLRP